MNGEMPGDDSQRRFDDMDARVAANRADIDALTKRADAANHRSDASDQRATAQAYRMNDLESRLAVDQRVIAQLKADGLLSDQHVADLEQALRSSRRIGAALGIVMAQRQIDEAAAFEVLSRASQNSNRKLRLLADDVVDEGVGALSDL